jgi:hypothetical protein
MSIRMINDRRRERSKEFSLGKMEQANQLKAHGGESLILACTFRKTSRHSLETVAYATAKIRVKGSVTTPGLRLNIPLNCAPIKTAADLEIRAKSGPVG